MLCELVVEGLGVIESAELHLDRGMSAITGETGAGKTLVVAALSLLLGGRADRALVREGAPEARVQGGFLLPPTHPAVEALRAHGALDDDPRTEEGDIEIVIARTVGAGGRGKARVNGRLVPISALAEVGASLVEIAGQQEHQRLSSAAYQRLLLDDFAGPEAMDIARSVTDAVRQARMTESQLDELRASEKERRRELDIVAFEVNEIEAGGVRVGESEELAEEGRRLEHAETIAAGLERTRESLRGEGRASDLIAGAARELSTLADKEPDLGFLADRLEAAAIEITDVADELGKMEATPDPEALAATRERLAVLAHLKRKYGDDEVRVLEYLERARARHLELETLDSDLEMLEEATGRLTAEAREDAARLGDIRRAVAVELEEKMNALLNALALKGARFEIGFEDRSLYEGGLEQAEFKVAVNAGETPRPIAKVASGGELARIALALHLLTASEVATTMVFDEIDAGVGGEAAQSIGRALADLARRTDDQVVVVTHLPQVAAFADHHLRVTKSTADGRSSALVEPVGGEERVVELSRMLAGLPGSDSAQEHAQELLELARSGGWKARAGR